MRGGSELLFLFPRFQMACWLYNSLRLQSLTELLANCFEKINNIAINVREQTSLIWPLQEAIAKQNSKFYIVMSLKFFICLISPMKSGCTMSVTFPYDSRCQNYMNSGFICRCVLSGSGIMKFGVFCHSPQHIQDGLQMNPGNMKNS